MGVIGSTFHRMLSDSIRIRVDSTPPFVRPYARASGGASSKGVRHHGQTVAAVWPYFYAGAPSKMAVFEVLR